MRGDSLALQSQGARRGLAGQPRVNIVNQLARVMREILDGVAVVRLDWVAGILETLVSPHPSCLRDSHSENSI